jgi:hypothetical protein
MCELVFVLQNYFKNEFGNDIHMYERFWAGC